MKDGNVEPAKVEAASRRFAESEQSAKTRQDAASTAKVEAASRRFPEDLFGFFDPAQPIGELSGNLPHWRQEGVTYFVTFRLADSLPQARLAQWLQERETWLKLHPSPRTRTDAAEYHRLFVARIQKWLDAGYGDCVLARPEIRHIVETALKHFNGRRYALDDWTIMPYHVHALVSPLAGYELSQILHSWKSYTAKQAARLLSRQGSFWQKESFDHIVRSAAEAERIREYILNNPCGLPKGTYSRSAP